MVLSGVSVSAAPDNTGTETSGESQDTDQSVTLDNEEPDATGDVTADDVQEENPEENQTDDKSDGTAESAKESTEDPGAGICGAAASESQRKSHSGTVCEDPNKNLIPA